MKGEDNRTYTRREVVGGMGLGITALSTARSPPVWAGTQRPRASRRPGATGQIYGSAIAWACQRYFDRDRNGVDRP